SREAVFEYPPLWNRGRRRRRHHRHRRRRRRRRACLVHDGPFPGSQGGVIAAVSAKRHRVQVRSHFAEDNDSRNAAVPTRPSESTR
ncbi:unnamed protein product, partial [Ectocarpus fasciculatus]